MHLFMNIRQSSRSYEDWMRACAPVVESQLAHKHQKMKEDPFEFFRGTYYRWAQVWPQVCPECVKAPRVLSVGDVHVNSFGTWRDAEGRLCWGIDDFDEAWPLPYTNDLVRLATSVKLARKLGYISLRTKTACEVILAGYARTLKHGGCPIVLAEEERRLETLGIAAIKPPDRFWEKLNQLPTLAGRLPGDAKKALERTLPKDHLQYRVIQREAGVGSLGHQRFVAIAECQGGFIAREAKRVVLPAGIWIDGGPTHRHSYYQRALSSAIRSPDPYQGLWKSWVIRRLSPESNPIAVEDLPRKRDEETLLLAMGSEVANVHLGQHQQVSHILKNLHRREANWLRTAAKKMAALTLREWKEYRG